MERHDPARRIRGTVLRSHDAEVGERITEPFAWLPLRSELRLCRVSEPKTQIIQYSRADLVNHIGRNAQFFSNICRLALLDNIFSKNKDMLG